MPPSRLCGAHVATNLKLRAHVERFLLKILDTFYLSFSHAMVLHRVTGAWDQQTHVAHEHGT